MTIFRVCGTVVCGEVQLIKPGSKLEVKIIVDGKDKELTPQQLEQIKAILNQ